jgi:hypothetical protein
VTPEQIRDIREYCNRDWALIARSKADFCAEQGLTGAARLRIAAELYEHARARRPDWPTAAEREADLDAHIRLSENLRAVKVRPR